MSNFNLSITTDGKLWYLDCESGTLGELHTEHPSPEQAELALRDWVRERRTRPCGAAPNGLRGDAGIVRKCDCFDCAVGAWS